MRFFRLKTAVAFLALLSATCPYRGTAAVSDEVTFNENEVHRAMARGMMSALRGSSVSSDGDFEGLGRTLAAGDFDEFNKIFSTISVKLPDIDLTGDKKIFVYEAGVFSKSKYYIELRLWNLVCGKLSLHDITLQTDRESDQRVKFTTKLLGLDVECTSNYWFKHDGYLAADYDASGTIKGETNQASLDTFAYFTSESFDLYGPQGSESSQCTASIPIKAETLTITGSSLISAANAFFRTFGQGPNFIQRKIIENVQDTINTEVCTALKDVISDSLNELIGTFSTTLEQYVGRAHVENDPLLAEKRMNASGEAAGIPLLDFRTNSWFQMIEKDFIDGTLGKKAGSDNHLKINEYMNNLTDNTGELDLALGDLLPNNGEVVNAQGTIVDFKLNIKKIWLGGLNTFTHFDFMNSISAYTLSHQLGLERLDGIIDLEITLAQPTAPGSLVTGIAAPVTESVQVTTGLRDLFINVSTLLAINIDYLYALQVGGFFVSPKDCIFAALFEGNVTAMKVTLTDLLNPAFKTGLNTGPGVLYVVENLVNAVFEMYEKHLLGVLPNALETTVREEANRALKDYLDQPFQERCPRIEYPTGPPVIVDFNEKGGLYAKIQNIVQSEVLRDKVSERTKETRSPLNDLIIDPLTKEQSGTFGTLKWYDLIDVDIDGKKLGKIVIKLQNVSLRNVDTVHNVEALTPVPNSSHVLHNKISIGAPRPLKLHADILLAASDGDLSFYNKLSISFDANNLTVIGDVLAKIDRFKLEMVRLDQILLYPCWLATLHSAAVETLEATYTSVGLNVDCEKCSSDLIMEMANNTKKPEVIESLQVEFKRLTENFANQLKSDDFSNQIGLAIDNAREKCLIDSNFPTRSPTTPPPTKTPANGSVKKAVSIEIWIAVALSAGIVGFCGLHWKRKKRRNAEKHRRMPSYKDLHQLVVKKHLVADTSSIFTSYDTVPLLGRWGVPICLAGSIVLFATGHLALGATVDIDISLAGEPVSIPAFFVFSIAQSTIEMWQAGAKELAILIALFSGLWPYAKCFTSIFLWFAPPTLCHPAARGNIYIWLDTLGKWSMIDIFVLVMSLVAFRISITSPDTVAFLPLDFYTVDLQVTPVWGLYANLLAQMISQFVSHFIIKYHRDVCAAADNADYVEEVKKAMEIEIEQRAKGQIVCSDFVDNPMALPRRITFTPRGMPRSTTSSSSEASTPRGSEDNPETARRRISTFGSRTRRRTITWVGAGTEDIPDEDRNLAVAKESLRDHVYNVSGTSTTRFVITSAAAYTVDGMLALLFCLLIGGCITPSFRMETWGLVGVALDFGRDDSRGTSYSVFSVASLISSQAKEGDLGSILGIYWIAIVFVICALIVPLLQVLTLSVMWSKPMTLMQQKKSIIVNEIIAAWQYLEVYLIAIVVAMLQIGQVSGFMVGKECDPIMKTLEQLAAAGILTSQDSQCFYVHATVEGGCFVLLAAAFVLNGLCRLILSAAHSAIEDREERIKGWKFPDQDDGAHRNSFFRNIGRLIFKFATRDLTVIDKKTERDPGRRRSVIAVTGWETMWHHGRKRTTYLNVRTGEMQFAAPSATVSSVLKTRESTLTKQRGPLGIGRDPLTGVQNVLKRCGWCFGRDGENEKTQLVGVASLPSKFPAFNEAHEEL